MKEYMQGPPTDIQAQTVTDVDCDPTHQTDNLVISQRAQDLFSSIRMITGDTETWITVGLIQEVLDKYPSIPDEQVHAVCKVLHYATTASN